MLRNAFLTFPLNDNAGLALPFVHSMLRLDLCKAFGGVTVSTAQGSWIDSATGREYHEPVNLYKIAAEWNADQVAALRTLAARYGALAEQLAVMVELADGRVEFINPESELRAYLTNAKAEKLAA